MMYSTLSLLAGVMLNKFMCYPQSICILLTCSIPVVSMYFQSVLKTVRVLIRWLHEKPADLDLHCFQINDKSGFSRTRVKNENSLTSVSLTSLTLKWEHSGLVVVCLTRDRGAAGLSLTCVTVLCPCLVLVQPRKTCPNITERFVVWDVKNQIKNRP